MRARLDRALTAVAVAVASLALILASMPAAVPVADGGALSVAEECRKALGYPGRTSADRTWLRTCERALTPPSSTPSPSSSSTTAAPTTTPPVATTLPPTTTPGPTTVPPTTAPPGPSECPAWPAFVTVSCTGFAHHLDEAALRTCDEGDGENDGHLTVARTFVGCRFAGAQSFIRIRAAGVVIRDSLIEGCVATHYLTQGRYMGLQLVDVEIRGVCTSNAPVGDGADYSCLRCYVHDTGTGLGGGDNVSIVDSYVTRMVYSDGAHQAAIGMNHGRNIRIEHNTLNCFRIFPPGVPQRQGCSAALSLYDEGVMDGVVVTHNLFNAAGEYCVYTGGPTAKNVRFVENVFGQLHHPQCGNAGPVHSWYPGNEGYAWSGNVWPDGTPVIP